MTTSAVLSPVFVCLGFFFFFKHKRPQISVKVRCAQRILGSVGSAVPMTCPGPGGTQRLLKKRGRRRVQTFISFSDISRHISRLTSHVSRFTSSRSSRSSRSSVSRDTLEHCSASTGNSLLRGSELFGCYV